jgi:hypothetical protein
MAEIKWSVAELFKEYQKLKMKEIGNAHYLPNHPELKEEAEEISKALAVIERILLKCDTKIELSSDDFGVITAIWGTY